jgi:hypothetical protein
MIAIGKNNQFDTIAAAKSSSSTSNQVFPQR